MNIRIKQEEVEAQLQNVKLLILKSLLIRHSKKNEKGPKKEEFEAEKEAERREQAKAINLLVLKESICSELIKQ